MELKKTGLVKINNYEFEGIEGGFGENKKAISAADIAKIHRRELKEVNKLINNNRDKFKDFVDVIDLLSDKNFEVILNNLGLKTSNGQKYA